MNKEQIKYFVYARKSTEGEDRQSLSIPSQIEDNLKIQERENLLVVDTITDSASAKVPNNRPGYSSMLRRIKKGEAAGIVVWKIDRLARNHLEWGELMHLLQNGQIRSIWTVQREYQSTDSALLISLEASMATQFSVDLSQIVKRGLEKKVQMGQPPLIARVGYLNTKLNEHGANSIIVDQERWPLIRKAFDMMLTGRYSMAKIASILNDDYGFRTRPSRNKPGGPLALSMLHRAFTDPFYTGHFYYKGKLHKGAYPAMISLEEFDTIQVVLGRKIKPKTQKHQFSFTGFIKCGSCGCAITATQKTKKIVSTGKLKTYVFYHCTKRRGKELCSQSGSMKGYELDALIFSELSKISLKPEWKNWAIGTAKSQQDNEMAKQAALLNSIEDGERRLHTEVENLLELRIRSEIGDEQYSSKKAEREGKIIRLKERKERLKLGMNDWINNLSELLNRVENASEAVKNEDKTLLKALCQYIGQNWTLEDKKLTFTRQNWFKTLEQIKSLYLTETPPLEPIKTLEEFSKTAAYKASIPYLCRLRDDVRTLEEDYDYLSKLYFPQLIDNF
jgi:site-specific DNA recombinase